MLYSLAFLKLVMALTGGFKMIYSLLKTPTPMTQSIFQKNAWYVACVPSDLDPVSVTVSKPFGRKICNEAMVFYRGESGQVVALEDFCPHRGAPLSLGSVCEGKLTCGYHGLHMGCDGKTVSMPGQRVRGFPAIRSFAAVERYGFVWVWPGDQAQADPATIQHLAWYDNPEWA